ncbi:MAG: PAS domain S-box protein [Prochloraceae cyanobacterium]|nr:PAS domain S-box protein [Prochloraceae cyanobacterium]
MEIAIVVICLLLALVFYLGIEVKQQAIALNKLQQEKDDSLDTFTSQTAAKQLLTDRNKTNEISEELIKNNNQRLYSTIANAPIPIIVHAEDGEILQINQVWTELTGYTLEDIPTIADWTEKAYGKRKKIVRSVIDSLYELKERVDEGEFKIITASGQVRIWDFSSAPLGKLLDGRRLVISTAKDITETKLTQKQLKQSEKMFRNTFEQAAVGMAHVAPNGKWLKVNQKLCQIVGYSKKELLQKTFQDITYAEDLKTDLEYIAQMLAGKIKNYSMEKRYIRKDASLVWIDLTVSLVRKSNREPDYFISVIEDISDRKRLELSEKKFLQRLSNQHQIDKAILEAQLPETIANIAISGIQKLIDSEHISIVTFDREKQTATVLANQGQIDELAVNGFQVNLSVWQNLIEQLENLDRNNHRYALNYLSKFPQLSAAIPQFKQTELDCFIAFPVKSSGKLLGILKIWLKNTEKIASEELEIIREVCDQVAIAIVQANLSRKIKNYTLELETKIAQRTAQLEDINQELNAFTYSISHDLKAPLRAIQGFATALQEDYGENLDEVGREYAWRLTYSAQEMEKLIQDLLSYSRLARTEIQMRSLSLYGVIATAIEQLKTEIAESGAQITVEEPLSNIFGNQTVLIQIVVNLLSNAIKFVSDGVKPKIRIWTATEGDRVRLWIADNGIGISPQYQERIFNVFERLHGTETYPGTGIGLAIVKKGMERLGGKFGLESEFDRGSRFWIEGNKKQPREN